MIPREIPFPCPPIGMGTNTEEENDSTGSNDAEDATTCDVLASTEPGITGRRKKTK